MKLILPPKLFEKLVWVPIILFWKFSFLVIHLIPYYAKTGRSRWPEWPSPHDYTSSIWDELKFIPIIGSTISIEVGSIHFVFPSLISRLPIKKIYFTPQAFQTPITYLRPTKNPKPCHHSRAKVMLQKTMLYKQCWSAVAKNNVAKAVLKQCCRSSVEAMLQKMFLGWCCKKRSSKK